MSASGVENISHSPDAKKISQTATRQRSRGYRASQFVVAVLHSRSLSYPYLSRKVQLSQGFFPVQNFLFFEDWPLTKINCHHHEIAIGILQNNLVSPPFPVAIAPPNLVWPLLYRPVECSEFFHHQINAVDVNLKHHTTPKRRFHLAGFPLTIPLANHDLRSFRSFQISKMLLCSLIGNGKTQHIYPECATDLKIINQKFTSQFRPARLRRRSVLVHF